MKATAKTNTKPRKKIATKHAAKKPTGLRRYLTRHVLTLTIPTMVVSLAIIIGAAAICHHNRNLVKQAEADAAYQKDVARFAAVEQDMDAAYASIVKTIGEPLHHEKTKSCGRPNLKFAEGNLGCSVEHTFDYVERNENSEMATQISGLISRYIGQIKASAVPIGSLATGQREDVKLTDFYSNKHNMTCALNYEYVTSYNSSADGHGRFRFYCASDVSKNVYARS